MAIQNNPLNSLSYTNKDFRAIYPELLDLVKKLTYKWDPSISNESDPGVILLKLNAIIGDKNNYNIDKNVLEVFPETLTQEVSARAMYHQLAYNMPWYRSATTEMTFKWVGEDIQAGTRVTIPRYTMISDADSSIVYTILEDVYFESSTLTTTVNAMQGIITDVAINGDKTLHIENIDHKNRLYLDDYSIAENGIFITNVDTNIEWTKVDNLSVQSRGNTYYEFGVDSRSNTCYVEFPEDIDSLIKNGLNIKYLISEGRNGNVAAKFLTEFYDDITVKVNAKDVTLNKDVCVMYNTSGTNNGEDPQSISDAYKSYRHVAGTFDTLVTLRDYINAIYQSNLVSNVVVSDRTTDVQDSYTVVTGIGASVTNTHVDKKADGSPNMNAFDLKLYMLQNPGVIKDLTQYQDSFEMVPYHSDTTEKVKLDIQQQKSILHDIQPLEENIPCLFRIAYPLTIKVVPQYQLTEMQQIAVKQNIMSALYDSLNSRKIDFGKEPNYNEIYDIITNADDRIKLAVIDDFEYNVYATYWTGTIFKTIPISKFEENPYVVLVNDTFANAEAQFKFKAESVNNPDVLYYICRTSVTKGVFSGYDVYKYDIKSKTFFKYTQNDEIDNFRKHLIARSVMAGITPLFEQEVSFDYKLNQQIQAQETDISRVSTDLVISPFGFEDDLTPKTLPEENKTTQSDPYTLKTCETIQLLAPSFINKTSFSNYVAYYFIKQNPSGDKEYTSISYDDYMTIVDKTNVKLYAMSEIFEYQNVTDYFSLVNDALTCNIIYYTPIYVKGKFYIESAEGTAQVVDTDLPPATWGGKEVTYYYDKYLKETVQFSAPPKPGYTYLNAWIDGKLGIYTLTEPRRIPANTDYKLQPGDTLVLFRSDENSSEKPPYEYYCYRGIPASEETDDKKSPIIRPSFTLNGTRSGRIQTQNMLDRGYIPYNNAEDSTYSRVSELFGKNDLSGTQTIDIRDMNEKHITAGENYYYFITNDITIEEETNIEVYNMSLTPRPNHAGDYQYVLKNGEYFIYTDKSKTQFEILGTGTLIIFKDITATDGEYPTSIDISVQVVDYRDIAKDGLSAFEPYTLLFGYNAILREQQIYNFAENDQISLTLKDTYKTNIYKKYPAFYTDRETVLQDFELNYASANSSFQTLPRIDISDDEAVWKGRAILNINSSYNNPQVINNDAERTSRRSIQQFTINDIKYPTNDEIKNNALLYLLTKVPVTTNGGENIDVTYFDVTGEQQNLELLIYSLNKQFSNDPFFLQDNTICMYLKKGTYQVTNIDLQEGYKYVLGITNTSTIDNPTKFTLTLLDKNKKPITYVCLNKDTNEYGPEHPWYFSFEGQTGITLQISVDNDKNPDAFLMFDDLIKYQDNEDFINNYEISFQDIINTIHTYSYASDFKYNYQVPEEYKIKDPLVGRTFFNDKHIFNKYAISEALLKNPSLKSSRTTSIISIINNR